MYNVADMEPLNDRISIAVAAGDGIGPEIMAATLRILEAAGAPLDVEHVQIGEQVYRQGVTSGVGPDAWEAIRRTRVLLKGPVTTPQGGGYKSVNVTLRKSLGLFANVRPCTAYHPFVATEHPEMDVVVIRENEEDLYAGIEHRQTDEVYQCLKLITRPGCERIARYAFEYARAHGRMRVTCMTKDNIMKLTDGLFHQVFDEVAKEYPEIKADHMIIDIGMARVAKYPERFDVIVLPNLYGDILSDVAAEVAGSVGLAGSANIGSECAMFEAIHGSAPDIAGQNVANPSGLLLAAVQMLVHLGLGETASRVQNAWLRTIEDDIHTADIHTTGTLVGTDAFADAVIERLGMVPSLLPSVSYSSGAPRVAAQSVERRAPAHKEIVGMDVFVQHRGSVGELAEALRRTEGDGLQLTMITNRGVMVWPKGLSETFHTDHWRCRFESADSKSAVSRRSLVRLLDRIEEAGIDFIKTENLCTFDGRPGYSLGQGQ